MCGWRAYSPTCRRQQRQLCQHACRLLHMNECKCLPNGRMLGGVWQVGGSRVNAPVTVWHEALHTAWEGVACMKWRFSHSFTCLHRRFLKTCATGCRVVCPLLHWLLASFVVFRLCHAEGAHPHLELARRWDPSMRAAPQRCLWKWHGPCQAAPASALAPLYHLIAAPTHDTNIAL